MSLLRFQPLAKAAILVLGLLVIASLAQQEKRTGRLTLPERESLARPLLVHAESASAAVDPDARAILLYRTAGGWLPLDPSRAVRLYHQAFAAARQSSGLRQQLEDAILSDLLPLSPSDLLGLLPNAESPTKTRLYNALINFELFQGDYPAAAQAFDYAIASGILPQRAAVHLLASLPRSAPVDRAQVFAAITHHYQAHPDPNRFHWSLADFIVRFYAELPPAMVLQAIETVLNDAEQYEKQHHGGVTSMGSGADAITFHSSYDLQLFAVAPILARLKPDLAASLLLDHGEAASYLKLYPQGLRSWNASGFYPGMDVLGISRAKPSGLQLYNSAEEGQNLSALDMGLEFTVPRNLNVLGVTGSVGFFPNPNDPEASIIERPGGVCPSDVTHRLDLARSIPMTRKVPTACSGGGCSYADTFPRASLVQVIAERCTYYTDPPAARAALQEQIEILNQVPATQRVGYLATAADLYMRLGDTEAAAGVIQRGFSAARAIYELDAKSKLPKGILASAEAYRRMITLGVNVSLDATRKAIGEIPDPDLRELEKVMEARALLGVPVRRYILVSENGGICWGEVEVTYDQF
jgi:hypothetical protein